MHKVLVPVNLLFINIACNDLQRYNGYEKVTTGNIAVPIVILPMVQKEGNVVNAKGDINSHSNQYLSAYLHKYFTTKDGFLHNFRRTIAFLHWNMFGTPPAISDIERDHLIVERDIERCCLAKAIGKSWLHVLMTDDVFAKWCNRRTEELDNFVVRTQRTKFYNPVDHPAYRKAKVIRRDSIRLDKIRQLFGPVLPGLSGLDIGCNMGYMSHHLQRQGFYMTGIDYDDNHLSVAQALNQTYNLNVKFENCYFKQFQAEESFDITLALTVLYHMFYRQDEQDIPEYARMAKKDILKKIDDLTRHALIWESGPEPEREIDFICSNSNLCSYLSLCSTKGTGKKRELGVFLKPGTSISDYLKQRHDMYFA